MTASDVLVEKLMEWGVDTVFGLPGDGINGIMEALRTRQDKIRFVQVRHEESAAFMACGYAKMTGRLGVCLATSGPGGIHLLNGLYDAKLDGAPVLAITGLQYHDLIGTFTQQDVELDKLFIDVCAFNQRIMGEILNQGKKIAILAGQGALHATDELEEIAEILAAPIAKPLLGKACVPDDSPYTTGSIGLLGTAPSQESLENCDTLLMIGTSFPYIEFLPKPDQARGVQIELDPARIGLRYPIEAPLVGDARATLKALIPRLKKKDDRSFLEKAQKGMKEWNEFMLKLATVEEKPMKPQVVAHAIGQRLRNDAIVTCDSGTIATWWARHIPAKRGQKHTLSGTLASMAPGLPYAIAAQWAYPERQVVAFVGDGGFSMLMAEFATAVKYKLPIKVCVIKNHYLGMIKWEQMVFLGNPEYGVELHPIDFAAFARACGGIGYFLDDPKRAGNAVDEWLKTPGPALLEAEVDPFTAPMPAKIKAEQAFHFAESLARGEPDAMEIAKEAFKDKARQLV